MHEHASTLADLAMEASLSGRAQLSVILEFTPLEAEMLLNMVRAMDKTLCQFVGMALAAACYKMEVAEGNALVSDVWQRLYDEYRTGERRINSGALAVPHPGASWAAMEDGELPS